MSLTDYVTLGKSGLRVSPLCVGAMTCPAQFMKFAPMFSHGGATVNGIASAAWPLAPQSDEERH